MEVKRHVLVPAYSNGDSHAFLWQHSEVKPQLSQKEKPRLCTTGEAAYARVTRLGIPRSFKPATFTPNVAASSHGMGCLEEKAFLYTLTLALSGLLCFATEIQLDGSTVPVTRPLETMSQFERRT